MIYGKDGCGYTQAARESFAQRNVAVEYVNVQADAARLKEMLKHTQGRRVVPVIVEDGRVTIGFNGTCGV